MPTTPVLHNNATGASSQSPEFIAHACMLLLTL